MKRLIILAVWMLLCLQQSFAQEHTAILDDSQKAIYSILISNTNQTLCSFVDTAFINTPLSSRYNGYRCHDLGVKIISLEEPFSTSAEMNNAQRNFLSQNKIAGRLIAKWFHRNPNTGECDLTMFGFTEDTNITNIDSTAYRYINEQLSNTYVLVNDVRYIEKADAGRVATNILGALSFFTIGIGVWSRSPVADLLYTLEHFQVVVTSHLYRLVWNGKIAKDFFETMYTNTPDITKRDNFNAEMANFQLYYIGHSKSQSENLSQLESKDMDYHTIVQTACCRAIDNNITNLSQKYDYFGFNTYLESASPIMAKIGVKEGITLNSHFEVIDKQTNQSIAVIKPIAIWDNRYNSTENNSVANYLKATIFKQISGEQILPGMQIRPIQK